MAISTLEQREKFFYPKHERSRQNHFIRSKHSQSHRNQFILGPDFISAPSDWIRLRPDDSFCITSHPNLNAYHAVHNDKSLTLLGSILDPYNPGHTNEAIIDKLLSKINKRVYEN